MDQMNFKQSKPEIDMAFFESAAHRADIARDMFLRYGEDCYTDAAMDYIDEECQSRRHDDFGMTRTSGFDHELRYKTWAAGK